jgi:hypothetical protein
MTVEVRIGRRVPRHWFRRGMDKMKGMLTFQENIWIMIERSMNMAKKKAQKADTLSFVKKSYKEPEDLNWDIEWIHITIDGTPDQETEEYEEAMQMYKSLGNVLKKDLKMDAKDSPLSAKLRTKQLSPEKIQEAYDRGYGASENNTIAQKLLDLGIMTHIEKIE